MSWKINRKGETRSEIAKKNNFGKWMNGKKMPEEQKLKQSEVAKKNKVGLWMKGKTLTDEIKRKISLSNKGKIKGPMHEETKKKISVINKGNHYSPETEFKIGTNLKENNYNWKGDDAGYFSKHIWLRKNKYNFGFCETCGVITKKLEVANIKNHEYTRDINDYNWLCISCHRKMDSNNIMEVIN